MTAEVKAVQTTTSWTPALAQVHVTGLASPLPPRNKDQSADAAKNHYLIFLIIVWRGAGERAPI